MSENPLTVRELIARLQTMPQDKLVELEAGGDWIYANPHSVREQGDVVLIISAPDEDEDEAGGHMASSGPFDRRVSRARASARRPA